jgi:hypothetical protein
MMFSDEDGQYLAGLALGDGYIAKKSENSYRLQITHCDKQFDYLKCKADRLGRILDKQINIMTFDNCGHKGHRIQVSHPYFGIIHKWLYGNQGKKFVTLSFLQGLSDEAVAYWYMDDGSLISKNHNGKCHAKEVVFSMYVSEAESLNAIRFFKERFDADFTIKRNRGKCSVRCGTKSARKLLLKLQEFKCTGMEYKFEIQEFKCTGMEYKLFDWEKA